MVVERCGRCCFDVERCGSTLIACELDPADGFCELTDVAELLGATFSAAGAGAGAGAAAAVEVVSFDSDFESVTSVLVDTRLMRCFTLADLDRLCLRFARCQSRALFAPAAGRILLKGLSGVATGAGSCTAPAAERLTLPWCDWASPRGQEVIMWGIARLSASSGRVEVSKFLVRTTRTRGVRMIVGLCVESWCAIVRGGAIRGAALDWHRHGCNQAA